ncbi:thiol:disulfide interchange protein DsbA/DsbL [Streptacidiphilus rugosus]|uniref:thiol:disulfide interchange protein DsbA/DsbL n=1 Tax=Streptacidiphilus rugosus TaxID=405783 RepID=UPI000565DB76|nr:thiol:disulfide interchange protein DsbA/DsbL [Streptacidiphilus rugosus]
MRVLIRLALAAATCTSLLAAAPAPAPAPASMGSDTSTAAATPAEGAQYVRLAQPVKTSPREVVEVFWYNCPHSYQLEQPLDDWAARQNPPVVVRRIPAAWPDKPVMMAYAKLYYTLDKLGVAQREAIPVFRAVRDQGMDLTNETAVLSWAADNGLDPNAVKDAYESQQVADETRAAPALRDKYQVNEMPSVVVGGTYRTSPFMTANGVPGTVPVVDYLYRRAHG